MTVTTYSSLSTYAAVILLVLEKNGYAVSDFETFSGIDLSNLVKNNERIPSNEISRIWDFAEQFTNNPEIGINAIEFFQPAAWKSLGFSLLCSRDIRDALERIVKYCSVLTDSLNFELHDTNNEINFSLTPALGFNYSSVQLDYGLGCMLKMLGAIVPWELKLERVDLVRSTPENIEPYHDIFGSKIEFSSKTNNFYFELSEVDTSLPLHDPEAIAALDRVLESYLVKYGQSNFVRKTSKEIIRLLPGKAPTENDIAFAMNMSKRNLQRKLKDVDLTYGTLSTDIRRGLAKEYIRDLSLSLSEVAYLLGYSDQSTFTRAFGSWFNQSPKRYRSRVSL